MPPQYKNLNPEKIASTIERLGRRVTERFPDASLGKLVRELGEEARTTVEKSEWIRRPHIWPRVLTGVVLVAIFTLLSFHVQDVTATMSLTGLDFIQTLEATLGSAFFLSAAVLFVMTLEARVKRRRALSVIHDLRSMAHIVDMHQLTKDPERLTEGNDTASSPIRALTSFELGRYYDYCSETLSLISKVASVYVEGFADPVVLGAVDEVETLCTGLSRKVWQKIMVLDHVLARTSA